MMRKIGWCFLMCLALFVSCKNSTVTKDVKIAANESSKQNSGILLKIEDAALVQDEANPKSNTAEWSFNVEHPGRYEVWLSSITCDTMNMGFDTAVTITAGDSRIEKLPLGDDIVLNAGDIKAPWYRADSEMGTFFFDAPGEYVVQVISEKVKNPVVAEQTKDVEKQTMIKSVILKPIVY